MKMPEADFALDNLTTANYFDPGFKTRQVNPRGYTTTTSFSALDQPEQASISSIAAPEGVNVSISRDVFGKPLSITRSGGTVSATQSYVYDGNQLLCKTVEPETGATVQSLDGANNLSWRASGLSLTGTASCDTASVPAASKTSFSYDARNRLKNTSYGDASPGIIRTLTADGLLATVSSNGSTWTYGYNKLRLLSQENLLFNAQSYTSKRIYNANGHLSQLTYPPDGNSFSLDYAPNALGQPTKTGTSTTNYASTVRHHPNGAVASYTLGNGKVHTLTQNTRGLPASNSDTGVLQDSYGYDAQANVTSITDSLNGKNRSMGYDGLDRLTSANSPAVWGTASYSYVALDNPCLRAYFGCVKERKFPN